jgi:hypothetical protein
VFESSVFDESGDVVEQVELAEDSPSFAVLQRWRADFGKLPLAAAQAIMV